MRIRPNAYTIALTLLLCLLPNERVVFGQETCPVQYGLGSKPMLFGGLYEAGRCTSFSGCQPRDDFWGKKCEFRPGSAWGVCTTAQTKHSYDLVKTLGGGSILDLSPCDILPYLRGRTTWLIGDSHSKTFYWALQCFLIDFWDHRECQASSLPEASMQLRRQPAKQGLSNCIHLLGRGGGRVCMVEAVLGTNLVNNTEVRAQSMLFFYTLSDTTC
ncbi:hypothetical protein COO60DRAFT_640959 [Scenedesmus sp. NREL 46B-D3]|nr:hypothetical protein COO60DRAFT_640959 [Scenedesmus sp. NREL 46B-D3]